MNVIISFNHLKIYFLLDDTCIQYILQKALTGSLSLQIEQIGLCHFLRWFSSLFITLVILHPFTGELNYIFTVHSSILQKVGNTFLKVAFGDTADRIRQTDYFKKCCLKSNPLLLLLVPPLLMVIISKRIISSQGILQSHI